MGEKDGRRGQMDRFVKDMTSNGMDHSRAKKLAQSEAIKADRREAAKKR